MRGNWLPQPEGNYGVKLCGCLFGELQSAGTNQKSVLNYLRPTFTVAKTLTWAEHSALSTPHSGLKQYHREDKYLMEPIDNQTKI